MQTFSTNEICALCQVSRKQLRYYEEKGLLSQVPRHSGNNYRYYTHEHIYEIVAAKAMRDIDMSLECGQHPAFPSAADGLGQGGPGDLPAPL